MTRPRQAFTTVEILIVIAILLLLAGMLFVGMRYVGRTGGVNATRTTLANAKAMQAEFEANTRLDRIYSVYINDGYQPKQPLPAPALVTEGAPDRTGEIVHLTHEVMEELLRIPNNRRALEQIPPDRLLRDEVDQDHAPVFLDAWNNPIIFVPEGGLNLDGVHPAQNGNSVIISSAGPTPYDAGQWPPPGARPFFASAGPSGDFQDADDNIYSFED